MKKLLFTFSIVMITIFLSSCSNMSKEEKMGVETGSFFQLRDKTIKVGLKDDEHVYYMGSNYSEKYHYFNIKQKYIFRISFNRVKIAPNDRFLKAKFHKDWIKLDSELLKSVIVKNKELGPFKPAIHELFDNRGEGEGGRLISYRDPVKEAEKKAKEDAENSNKITIPDKKLGDAPTSK